MSSLRKKIDLLEKKCCCNRANVTVDEINQENVFPLNPKEGAVYINTTTGTYLYGGPAVGWVLTSSSCCYYEVTYAEAAALIAADTLIPSGLYKITDRGDRGIFLEAESENQFNPEGVRLMLVPSLTFGDTIVYKDALYDFNVSYSIGDVVIWLGKIYTSIINSNITPPYSSDNWDLIPKDSFTDGEYTELPFGIIYDFVNDWISKQWDTHGNIFGVDYLTSLTIGYENPVDISDWNLANIVNDIDILFYGNVCYGVWGNLQGGADRYIIINNNIPFGAIFFNKTVPISNNTVILDITNNLGIITYNRNNGGIYGNTTSIISHNSNNGDISGNDAGSSTIYNNQNNGYIVNNTVGDGIKNNQNNGYIANNIIVNRIEGNTNGGNIETNTYDAGTSTGVATIRHNSNALDILNNTNNGTISNNSNNGSIDTNDNTGNITYNLNNGDISGNTSGVLACNIINNNNNGNISGAQIADVTDTIVNK